MKSTSKFKRLMGVDAQHGPIRLARMPFLLSHIVAYAVAFFLLQVIGYLLAQTGNPAYEMGDFGFAIALLLISIVLLPIHIRRGHDLAWSAKMPFWFSIVPSIVRLICFAIPFAVFVFAPGAITGLFKFMPYIGFLYWVANQIQFGFLIVLAVAPGTGTYNRFGDETAKVFGMKSLYGFRLFKANNKVS